MWRKEPTMTESKKIRLLVNLGPGFFRSPELEGVWRRLAEVASVRKTSHDTADEIEADLAWADAVIMWSWPVLTEDLLAKAPNLRFAGHINANQAGVRAELARGIAVSDARHGWSPAVAELALGLILDGLRKISDYHAAMRAGRERWVEDFPADVDPLERQLTGRPVGIVGLGGIGRRLAELLAPFHVELRVFDPYLPEETAKRHGAKQVPLMELITESDVVVISAANNEGTKGLIGAKEIAAFRKDALLVNIGRASLIDMDALERRLGKGDLFAALDVFGHEPLEKDSALRGLPNAYLTPHRAGGLMESVLRIMDMLADDLEAFLAGKERARAVTEEMLPCLPD